MNSCYKQNKQNGKDYEDSEDLENQPSTRRYGVKVLEQLAIARLNIRQRIVYIRVDPETRHWHMSVGAHVDTRQQRAASPDDHLVLLRASR